jgi:hypothetical protein
MSNATPSIYNKIAYIQIINAKTCALMTAVINNIFVYLCGEQME